MPKDAATNAEGSVFTANDILRLAGLTYRQLNDWDTRGVLPHERSNDSGWRRFTPREVFALMVCSEVKSRFGVPLERCKYILDFMGQEGANHLQTAIELMSSTGAAVWFLTDFESVFIMDQEFEFIDLWQAGMFHGDDEQAFVLLKVSPLVNRLLAMVNQPLPPIKTGGKAYADLRKTLAVYPEESALLHFIRSADVQKIEIVPVDGKIKTIRSTKRVDLNARVADLLGEHDFQTLTLTAKDGHVVNITQEAARRSLIGNAQ